MIDTKNSVKQIIKHIKYFNCLIEKELRLFRSHYLFLFTQKANQIIQAGFGLNRHMKQKLECVTLLLLWLWVVIYTADIMFAREVTNLRSFSSLSL